MATLTLENSRIYLLLKEKYVDLFSNKTSWNNTKFFFSAIGLSAYK
jgi:hypothetical protein